MRGQIFNEFLDFSIFSRLKIDWRLGRKPNAWPSTIEAREFERGEANFGNWKFRDGKLRGFTIVEMVVVMAVITAISAVVLVNFGGLREGAALTRSARELALSIRRAQNMSLAVTRVDTLVNGELVPAIPPAVGLRLEQDRQSYFLFADMVQDNKYDAELIPDVDDALISDDVLFEQGVRIKALTYRDALEQPRSISVAHVVFVAPEAAVSLTDGDGSSLGDLLEIELALPSGRLVKKIEMRMNGQVSIK